MSDISSELNIYHFANLTGRPSEGKFQTLWIIKIYVFIGYHIFVLMADPLDYHFAFGVMHLDECLKYYKCLKLI